MPHLPRSLTKIDLSSTAVTDAGLELLCRLPLLSRLRLEGCCVSRAAVETHLPNLPSDAVLGRCHSCRCVCLLGFNRCALLILATIVLVHTLVVVIVIYFAVNMTLRR